MKDKSFVLQKMDSKNSYVYNSIFIMLISLFILYVPVVNSMQPLIKAPYSYYANFLIIFVLWLFNFLNSKNANFTKEYLQSMGCLYVLGLYCAISSFWSEIQFETLWRTFIIFGPIFAMAYVVNV
ncbi:capsular biosynthesis protein, partial [Bacillus cereus]|nr:capsular biosynthesis protein [Bacillus cereus]